MNGRAGAGLAIGLLLLIGALAASFLMDGPEVGTEEETNGASPISLEPAEEAADISYDDQRLRIRVEVLNGAGDAGAAARVTEQLRGAGFDVKTYGNAGRYDHERTLVLDRSGRPGAAGSVAAALGGAEVEERLDPELYLDATVILGKDWRSRLNPPIR
ncbi:MAG: LytR C-terminal domain-containing protein [Gemmatimonadota bacterium]